MMLTLLGGLVFFAVLVTGIYYTLKNVLRVDDKPSINKDGADE